MNPYAPTNKENISAVCHITPHCVANDWARYKEEEDKETKELNAPIPSNLNLRRMRPEELHVPVLALHQERNDQAPGLPSLLQLKQLVIEPALVIWRERMCG